MAVMVAKVAADLAAAVAAARWVMTTGHRAATTVVALAALVVVLAAVRLRHPHAILTTKFHSKWISRLNFRS